MRKTLLFSAALFAVSHFAQAQITLTEATHMPQPGINVYQHFEAGTTLSLPDTGASITWNYGSLTPDSARHLDFFNCVPQADCAGFGNANLVQGVIADSAFNYYKTSTNLVQLTGASSPFGTTRYSDVLDYYRYPFTYNTQYSDAYAAILNIPSFGLTLSTNGTATYKGAGYGTLITPLGTYPNVLMMRVVSNYVATTMGTSTPDLAQAYAWFDASTRFPILTMNFNYSDNGSGQFVIDDVNGDYMDARATAVSTVRAEETFRLAPNPSTGITWLEIPTSFSTKEVVVTDLTGKTVFSQSLNGAASMQISTEGWAKGLYLVRLQSEGGKMLMNKLSVQ